LADASKVKERLNWEAKVRFKELVRIMVDADMEAIGLEPVGEGKDILQKNFSGWHQWDNSVSVIHESLKRGVEWETR
jgi:GDPmannose 4,6-dehydratase